MQYFMKLSLFFSNDCSHKHLVDTVSYLQVHTFHSFFCWCFKTVIFGFGPSLRSKQIFEPCFLYNQNCPLEIDLLSCSKG